MAPFQLPHEQFYKTLFQRFPCREQQIRTLATLLHPTAAPCGSIVIHGAEATGKSAVTAALLEQLTHGPTDVSGSPQQTRRLLGHAIVNSDECVNSRHLFERTLSKVADALHWNGPSSRRCETLAQLTVGLSNMLKYTDYDNDVRFVIVFDAIDRQRDALSTLLPGLARLSEIIPFLTTVFIVTFPSPSLLSASFVPHINFRNYTKAEFIELLSVTAPPTLTNTTAEETADLWSRFCGAVHDALTRVAGRTLPVFQEACATLWPRFTAPVLVGTHGPREFSKLLIVGRIYFQDEALLDPGLVIAPPSRAQPGAATSTVSTALSSRDLSSLLPTTARIFLLCAYLASHNASKHDLTLFSTYYHGRKRRRGGRGARGGRQGLHSKQRKIARKLLGAHSFTLERMLAIFVAVRSEWTCALPIKATGRKSAAVVVDGDAGMAIATLSSLRLLLRVGGPGNDPMDRAGKWRVNVGWETVRSLGRSMGVEIEDWLID